MNQLPIQKYKTITIKLNNPISNEAKILINSLNKKLQHNEAYFELSDKEINLYLKEIDLNKFNLLLNNLISIFNLQEHEKSIFDEILKRIKSIGSYGIKGGKRIYVDFQKERKVSNRRQKEAIRGKYFYANNAKFSKTINKVPMEYLNKIICGDSDNILEKFPENCVDLIFTSPPYNFGLDYENHEDGTNWSAYFDKLFSILKKCIKILKYGGKIAINVQPLFSDYIPIHHIISNFLMNNGLIWKAEIIWEKHNYNCKYTAWGSWKSPSNPYFKYTWEFIEVFCKGDLKHPGNDVDIDITSEEFKSWVYAKWDIAPERNMREWDHPAMFPEELAKRIIKLLSYKRDVVLDPFNGVGTTTKVAKMLERSFIGIDISKEYCEKAEQRLKEVDLLLLKPS
jgi:DNA modification methylase